VISSVKICAQENLSGEVTDQDGKKIGNVYIIIKNKEGEYKTTTNLKELCCFRSSADYIILKPMQKLMIVTTIK
jgi:hypothetical protein